MTWSDPIAVGLGSMCFGLGALLTACGVAVALEAWRNTRR